MASEAGLISRPSLTEEDIRACVAGVNPSAALSLSAVWLPVDPEQSSSSGATFLSCFPVMCRENGFMLLVPDVAGAELAIQTAAEGSSLVPAVYHGNVEVQGLRGKALGSTLCILVDLAWDVVSKFVKSAVLRGAQARNTSVLHFKVGASTGRPVASSAIALADEWVGAGAGLPETSAQEYLTGEELVADEAEDFGQPLSEAPSLLDEATALQNRVAELEKELAKARAVKTPAMPRMPAPVLGGRHGPEQRLFGQSPSVLGASELARLQQLAGSPPGRLGSAVARNIPAQPPADPVAQGLFAEWEKDVLEAPALDSLPIDPETVADPMQRLLLLQMQQNTALMHRLMQPKDPMTTLLSGGGASESGSSSGGARGCMAREVFLRTIQDLPKVGEEARKNALQELGISADKEDKDLMHLYIERRVPLADNKMLAHFAVLAAEGWSIAHQSGNAEMKGYIARILFFVEQCALDAGKLELGWLMSGFAEPNTHLHFPVKRTPGLKPFTRLASPLWVSANLAFLRDLDYMEGRIQTLGRSKGKQHPSQEGDDVNPGKPKPKPKKGKKGSGKDANPSDAAAI